MSESNDADDPERRTWTTRYRILIAVGSGFVALVCCWLLFTGDATERWMGGLVLVALVVWIFVYQALHRRGY